MFFKLRFQDFIIFGHFSFNVATSIKKSKFSNVSSEDIKDLENILFDIKSRTNNVFFFSKISCHDILFIFDQHCFVYNFMDLIEQIK